VLRTHAVIEKEEPLARAETFDARRLSMEAQEDLRRRVVAALDSGMSQLQAAHVFGVSRRAVGRWVHAYRAGGPGALGGRRRGRRAGQHWLSRPMQAELLEALTAAGPPGPGALWSRRAVGDLIEARTGLRLCPSAVGRYLTRWGFGALPAQAGHPPDLLRQRGASTEGAGARILWMAWTRPVPLYLGDPLLVGPASVATIDPGPAGVGNHLEVLIAQAARRDLLFLAARTPWNAAALADFAQRLVATMGHPVHLVIRSWPPEDAGTLRAWVTDPGPKVYVTQP
jgi:transposase